MPPSSPASRRTGSSVYGDGHLGRRTTGDVAEFLLSCCLRKLSVSQADSVTIAGSVAAFTGAAGEFVTAMGDPATFGMAKSILPAALADGADDGDPGQL